MEANSYTIAQGISKWSAKIVITGWLTGPGVHPVVTPSEND